MSTDIYFYGVIEPDEQFLKKCKAFTACQEAGINPPKELWDFFEGTEPNPRGLTVNIDSELVEINEYKCVHEINLKKLRPDVTRIHIGKG